mmetsp:Transcript_41594/g.74650  ORF Transcript_41594/g.74650 Transcript_41594/m.74650 type:complete len:248 (+) Transcript_41594:47-790(+)
MSFFWSMTTFGRARARHVMHIWWLVTGRGNRFFDGRRTFTSSCCCARCRSRARVPPRATLAPGMGSSKQTRWQPTSRGFRLFGSGHRHSISRYLMARRLASVAPSLSKWPWRLVIWNSKSSFSSGSLDVLLPVEPLRERVTLWPAVLWDSVGMVNEARDATGFFWVGTNRPTSWNAEYMTGSGMGSSVFHTSGSSFFFLSFFFSSFLSSFFSSTGSGYSMHSAITLIFPVRGSISSSLKGKSICTVS